LINTFTSAFDGTAEIAEKLMLNESQLTAVEFIVVKLEMVIP
jgi:hypothetical protein